MNTRILVNVDHGETRVAVLENDRLADFSVERGNRLVGNIYKGRVVNVLPGMDAAFVDIGLSRNAFIYMADVSAEAHLGDQSRSESSAHYGSITEALQVGDELLVQITRPPVGSKGARVTTRISLPGRYVVLLSRTLRHISVSRRIEDDEERARLQRLAERLCSLDDGLILRTEAESRSEAELRHDIESLVELRNWIETQVELLTAPCEIHRDLGLVGRVARDMFTEDVQELLIDSSEAYNRVVAILQGNAPHLLSKVKLSASDIPLFDEFELEAEVAKTLSRVVALPHGGQITIDENEALTSIDVDTGKYIGKTHLADTVLRTNLEAVEEVARQLRLRDIGGIVVIDFIDMDRVRDRIRVMNALEETLKRDHTRTRIINLSPLGLVEMTRRRRGVSLNEMLCRPCPYCSGRGRVRTAETTALDLRRKIRRTARRIEESTISVRCHPEVAAQLIGPDADLIRELEDETSREIYILVDPVGHVERSDIRPGLPSAVWGEIAAVDSGDSISVEHNAPTYPSDSHTFTTFGSHLVLLPELEDGMNTNLLLTVVRMERWFAVTVIASPPDFEPSVRELADGDRS